MGRFPKGGRPRIADAIRTDNGRIANSAAEGKRRENEHKSVAVSARMRMHGIAQEQASSQEGGYALGRLWLAGSLGRGSIAWQRLDAGKQMAEDYSRYYGLSGIPWPSPRAQNLFAVRSFAGEQNENETELLVKATKRKTAINTLLTIDGENSRRMLAVVEGVCISDLDGCKNLELLNRGLDKLAVFYGLVGKSKDRAA